MGATNVQAVDATGLGKIAVASGAADWGIGALQQALDAQMSAVYNVSRAVVVGMGAADMLDATNNYIDSRPETQYLAGRITLPDLVSTWLNEYARAKSIEDLGQIYEQLQSGITVDTDGVMYYNGQACAFMDEFCDWVWTSGPKLEEYAETEELPGSTQVDGQPVAVVPAGSQLIIGNGSRNGVMFDVYLVNMSESDDIYLYGLDGNMTAVRYGAGGNIFARNKGATSGSNGNDAGLFSVASNWTKTPVLRYGADSFAWNIPTGPLLTGRPGIPVVSPGGTSPIGNPGLFGGLSSLSVDPSDFLTVQQPEGDGWKVAPSEWLRVVTDVVSGHDNTTMTVTQDDTGVTQHVVVTPPDLPGLPGDPIQPAPEINPTVPDTTVPTFDLPDITGDWNGTSSYEVNIRDLFPFCIPFDILDACKLFAAEPVAPAFSIPIKSEAYGIDETVEFDLSPFDGVASAVRTVEKVAFLVGLALVTKQLLGG